jgi:CheY-like chemotaxis protein
MCLQIVEHIRALRGGSQPHLMRASDGNLYVVKLQGNPQGSPVLANELLASRLAEHLEIPIPRVEILELPAKLAGSLYFETLTGRNRISSGLQVGSRLVLAPTEGRIYDFLPPMYAGQLRNPEHFAGIHLFDLWTCNRDTRQAVYWKRPAQKLFTVSFIDNGYCFGGPEWRLRERVTIDSLPASSQYRYWLAKLESIAAGLLATLAAEIPVEWYFNQSNCLRDLIMRLVARRAELRTAFSLQPRRSDDVAAETILLVEDETELRQVLAEFLRESGREVLEACDGRHGLELAEQHRGPIDLLLTDIVMPRMSGNQLGREFRKLRPQAARMYMSGFHENVEVETEAILLRKPFRNQVLLAKVNEVLGVRPFC